MKRWLIDEIRLYCPSCIKAWSTREIEPLHLSHGFLVAGDDITEGWLVCPNDGCGRQYPIIREILSFPERKGFSRYDEWMTKAHLLTHYRGPAQDLTNKNPILKKTIEENDKVGFYLNSPNEDYYTALADFAGNVLRSNSKVLDLGCSVGRLAFELGRKAGFVIGADPSLEHIGEARSILQTGKVRIHLGLRRVSGDPKTQPAGQTIELPLENLVSDVTNKVEFIAADDETLPFAPKSFDVVFCASVIDRVEDPDAFVKKVDWFIRDGGYLVVSSPFDWGSSPAPRDRWLGFGSYGTEKGSPEKALGQLLRKRGYRLIKEDNIPWVTYSDCRHYDTWNVYVGLYQAVRPNVRLITSKEISPELVETYRRVYRDWPVYREDFSAERVYASLSECSTLLVASSASSNEPIGFAGGHEWTEKDLDKYRDAHKVLNASLGPSPVFYVDEVEVDTPFQRLGIGEGLLVMLLAHARLNGYHAFILITNPDNEAAIRMYRRNGFLPLYAQDGLVTHLIRQSRTVPERSDTDLRPYFYRIDDFSKVTLKNGAQVCLEFFEPESYKNNKFEALELFANQISILFGEAFYPSRHPPKLWDPEHIMKRLPKVKLGVLVFNGSPRKTIAYALFDQARWGEYRILFVDSMGVSKAPVNWQRTGLGTQIMREALKRLPAETVAARTQNPDFVLMLQKLKPQELLPGESGYSGKDLELIKAIKEQVIELHEADVDLSKGICKKAYRERKLGDYEIDLNNKLVSQIEQRFEALGFNRDDGDAVVVVAKGMPTPVD